MSINLAQVLWITPELTNYPDNHIACIVFASEHSDEDNIFVLIEETYEAIMERIRTSRWKLGAPAPAAVVVPQ